MTDNPTIYRKRGKLNHVFLNSGHTILTGSTAKNQVVRFKRANTILAEAREKIKKEKEDKARLLIAIANKPVGVKMKKDKEGKYFYQPRNEKGHVMARVNL